MLLIAMMAGVMDMSERIPKLRKPRLSIRFFGNAPSRPQPAGLRSPPRSAVVGSGSRGFIGRVIPLLRPLLVCLLAAMFAARPSHAAEWQWSVEMPGVVSPETGGAPRAFLWIPPDCQRVRGVVFAQQNLLEAPLLENPVFRAALRESGFAALWVTPPFDPIFRFDQGAGDRFDALLAALAKESGYQELAQAPVIPLGHSAAMPFPWNFAVWAPERTLAAISLSGLWPYSENESNPPWGDRTLEDVPVLLTLGEYEWAADHVAEGLRQREKYPELPLSLLVESSAGHFDLSAEKIAYLALYVRKVAKYRLPATAGPLDKPAKLIAIDPEKTGWLADRWRPGEPTRAQAQPVADYPEPDDAFWYFDEELAVATEKFRADQRGKKAALVGYVQNGAIIPQVASTHQQVTLPFAPIGDGLTFKLSGAFLDRVPEGRPERWTGQTAGSPIPHPAGGGPVTIDRIYGPVEKLADDTFAIRFDRLGFNQGQRSAEIWFAASHPGDRQFRRSVQQAALVFPLRNTVGADQRITFAEIANQRAGAKSVALSAKSAVADAKVRFYVREGPAEIVGDQLNFTAIPPRSRFPIKVTVVAWQWGRNIEPTLKSAEPVERTFLIEAK